MEQQLNRIVIRDGEYTDEKTVSALISASGISTEFNIEHLTLLCNVLAQTVADDEEGHVDLFIMKKGGEAYLCANLYAIYLTFNNSDKTLPALQAVIDAASYMVCRAVDRDIFVVQFRFAL